MIEQELQCANKHQKPILSVIFDNKFVKNQKLLCHECMETYTQDARIMGFKAVNQMIGDSQKQKREFLETLIDNDQKILKQIQLYLVGLRSTIIQELDSLDEITKSWIRHMDKFKSDYSAFSFFEELDKIISYGQEKVIQINKEIIFNEIKKINSSWSIDCNNQLKKFNQFEDSLKCQVSLKDLKIQEQDKPISSQEEFLGMLDSTYKAIKCIFNQQILNTKNELVYIKHVQNVIIKQNPIENQYDEFQNIFSLFKRELSETQQFIFLDNNQQNQGYLKIFRQDISKRLVHSNDQLLDMNQFYKANYEKISENSRRLSSYSPKENGYEQSFSYIHIRYSHEYEYFFKNFPQQFNQIMFDYNGWIKLYKELYDLIKLEIGNSQQQIEYLGYQSNKNTQISNNFIITDTMQKVQNNIKVKYNNEFAKFGVILSDIGERCIYYYSMLIIWIFVCRKQELKHQIIATLQKLLN
ncbi:unnamed protein product [Paramecium pentaurelia]|uniref:Uncharacterized protein n=1 Tax=Paramecium pentaurelia TaxID=43138 RepID=A0A8S1XD01_9CILI|nr:unnamed protein product [Paramecium pentaurelia]